MARWIVMASCGLLLGLQSTAARSYGNGPYLVIHAAETGPHRVNTGRAGSGLDYLRGEELGTGPMVELNLTKGETRILRLPTR